MIPDWMKEDDNYVPPKDGGTFVIKTIKSLAHLMARIKVQKGHEKKRSMPVLLKLILTLLAILTIAISKESLSLMAIGAVLLLYLATWPGEDIASCLKGAVIAALFTALVMTPAMLMNPAGIRNNLSLVLRVFLSVTCLNIFNHTSQWNHISLAMRKLHIPRIFIFTLDMTLKYIVLLGNLIENLLTSMSLRMVGKNTKKYGSLGGVMGVTFVRGNELNQMMYEAMQCRGFTGDYNQF